MLEAVARNYRGPARAGVRAPGSSARTGRRVPPRPRPSRPARRSSRSFPTTSFTDPIPPRRCWRLHRATGLATVLLAEVSREQAATKGATGRARSGRDGRRHASGDATWRTRDRAGSTPAGGGRGHARSAGWPFPETSWRSSRRWHARLPAGAELDDVPVLQRLAQRERARGRRSAGRGSSTSACPRATARRSPPSRPPSRERSASPQCACWSSTGSGVRPASRDADGLSAVVVAAAGAVGMPALGPPIVREGPRGVAVALLCREGHIVLHALPREGCAWWTSWPRAGRRRARGRGDRAASRRAGLSHWRPSTDSVSEGVRRAGLAGAATGALPRRPPVPRTTPSPPGMRRATRGHPQHVFRGDRAERRRRDPPARARPSPASQASRISPATGAAALPAHLRLAREIVHRLRSSASRHRLAREALQLDAASPPAPPPPAPARSRCT